jgi:site-specific DNA-methyltransferase (adenine-specific)
LNSKENYETGRRHSRILKKPIYNPQYWYSLHTRWNTQSAVDKQSNYGTHKENIAKSDGRRLPTTVLKFNRVERLPYQKPRITRMVDKTYTNENDIVLDNCMGVELNWCGV